MTLKEIVPEVEQLSQDELLILLEIVTRALRASLQQPEQGAEDQSGSSLERVLGMLTPDGPMPTDEELNEMRFQYLMEKYG